MKKALSIALIALISFTSCTKEGEPGPAGKDGKNGSSNISTYIVSTTASNWAFDGSDNSYNATVNISSITSNVVSNGSIQVFIGDGTGSAWQALPISYGIVQYNYIYEVGKVHIIATLSDGSVPANPGVQQYKFVVIPPGAKKQKPVTVCD